MGLVQAKEEGTYPVHDANNASDSVSGAVDCTGADDPPNHRHVRW